MSRTRGTSVKERIAAIEANSNGVESQNSVIRARFVPDVRGVNRYKHFHIPSIVTDPAGNKDAHLMTSLPFILRPGQLHYVDPTDNGNGVEKGARKKKTSVTLPQLTNINNNAKTQSRINENLRKERTAEKAALQKTSSESSSDSSKSSKWSKSSSTYSGRIQTEPLLAHRAKLHQQQSSKRTFASLGQRQNGVIINNVTVGPNLNVDLPPRSKSAHDIEAIQEPSYAPKQEVVKYSTILATTSEYNLRDIATQTLALGNMKVSTASVEFLNNGRATQTDEMPSIMVNNKLPDGINEQRQMEREALMEIIEDALGETFDKYSRVRTSQIIANSAKKQGQIWRDTKDFLANMLFPQAIELANRSTSKKKTAAEVVAAIRSYP